MVRFGFSMGAPLERTYTEPTLNIHRTYTEHTLRPERREKVAEMFGKKCSPISGVERLRLGGETI